MSSSAFTPTTTQVTTEVPVNVPVVTAWQDYTPVISNFGSGGGGVAYSYGKWRRVGDSIEIEFRFAKDATGGSETRPINLACNKLIKI